jgi:hypothetical protein
VASVKHLKVIKAAAVALSILRTGRAFDPPCYYLFP